MKGKNLKKFSIFVLLGNATDFIFNSIISLFKLIAYCWNLLLVEGARFAIEYVMKSSLFLSRAKSVVEGGVNIIVYVVIDIFPMFHKSPLRSQIAMSYYE